jgi:hypothetical protein
MSFNIANWTNIDGKGNRADYRNPMHRALIRGAVNHFFKEQSEATAKAAKAATDAQIATLQHFGKSENFPTSILETMSRFREAPAYDAAFERIFRVMDMTSYRRDAFSIEDVADGLTFDQVPVGEKARVYGMAGAKATVPFAQYAAGLNWHMTLFDDEEYYKMEDMAASFTTKAAFSRAYVAYQLIEAIGSGINLAWQAVDPSGVATSNENYNAIRDYITINKAVDTLFANNKDKGYGVTPQSEFVLLYPYQLEYRIGRAMGVRNMNISGSLPGVVRNITAVPTIMLTDATSYYVTLPGNKTQWGDRQRLTLMEETDALSYSQLMVGWMRFGGAIGDTEQFVRCATS